MTDGSLKLTDVVLTHRGREVRLCCAHDAFEISEFPGQYTGCERAGFCLSCGGPGLRGPAHVCLGPF